MFSPASKMCFSLGWWTVVAGAVYAAATGDRGGFTLLVAAGLAAATLGVAIFAFAGPDVDVRVAEGAAPARVTPQATEPAKGSPWPVGAAVALALLAIGAAIPALMLLGIVAALVVTGGWLAQAWREHPAWTPEMTERINDRLVVPIGLPATVITLAGIGTVSFSRVLLAVSKEAAVWIALGAAIAILGACAYVASRPRMGRAALGALATGSAVLVLASGIAGAVKGERQFHAAGEAGEHGAAAGGGEHGAPGGGGEHGAPVGGGEHGADDEHGGKPEGGGDHGSADRGGKEKGADSDVITVVARNIAFDKQELDLPALTEIDLVLDNLDSAPHNFALYRTEGGLPLFQGKVIEGHQKTTYRFTTPEAGIYHFQCDVHPAQMKGRAIVSPQSSVEPPVGGNVTTTSTSTP